MGIPIFIGIRDTSIAQLTHLLEEYHRAWQEGEHPGAPDAMLRIPFYCAEPAQEARSDPEEASWGPSGEGLPPSDWRRRPRGAPNRHGRTPYGPTW